MPPLLSGDGQRQIGAILGIGFYLCLGLMFRHISKMTDPAFCRRLAIGSAAWLIVFLAFDAWVWTTDGFEPRHLPSLAIMLGMTVLSALVYRRALRSSADEAESQ